MSRLINMVGSSLLSGGLIGNGSVSGYVTNATRAALGMGLSEFQDGEVHYFSKDREILKRAAIQTSSQAAYGLLRSYPRYVKYLEYKQRMINLQTNSDSSIVNESGQYSQLIKEQQVIAKRKNYTDSIVGRTVQDYLELTISKGGTYYNNKEGKVEPNSKYGDIVFVDLQPQVQVSSRNNIIMTTVQGRDYSRKEFISGGDLEFTIAGKVTSKYPDIYPEAEVSKLLKLMQYKGVVDCDNTILRQLNITQLIVLNYSLQPSSCRNIQPYTISCVAVEPSEAIELQTADQERVDQSLKYTNKWLNIVTSASDIIDPASLLKISKLWL